MIEEDPTSSSVPADAPPLVRKKRSGWFGLGKKPVESDDRPDSTATPQSFRDLDDRRERRPSRVLTKPPANDKHLPSEPPASAQSSEFPIRKERVIEGKKGLSRWLGKFRDDREDGGRAGKYFVSNVQSIYVTNS